MQGEELWERRLEPVLMAAQSSFSRLATEAVPRDSVLQRAKPKQHQQGQCKENIKKLEGWAFGTPALCIGAPGWSLSCSTSSCSPIDAYAGEAASK